MTVAVVSVLLAGHGPATPVGAVAILRFSLSVGTCPCVGVAAGLGAATLDGAYALIAVAGGTALARYVQVVAGPLHRTSAAALAMLATWTAATAVRRYRSHAAGGAVN